MSVWIHVFPSRLRVFFILIFLVRMNSNITWIHCAGDKVHCSRIIHGSHATIHTFKNYFVIVFSVFSKISCIQMNSKTLFIYLFLRRY